MNLLRRALALLLALNLAVAGGIAPADARISFDPSGTGKLRLPGLANVVAATAGALFDYSASTASRLITGDSIQALNDDTFMGDWGHALAGGATFRPAYGWQAVSGSEINEGDPTTNVKDLLFPPRKALLEGAVRPGDIASVYIGINTVAPGLAPTMIAGLKQEYAGLLDKGAFIEAGTILPSGTNSANADIQAVNDFIRALPSGGFTNNGTSYPGAKFMPVDTWAAWGGAGGHVGKTDSGLLHPNTYGAILAGEARRDAFKAAGRAYHPLYGSANLAANLMSNWNLAAGTAGTTSGTSTFQAVANAANPTIPTGVIVSASLAGLTIEYETILAYTPADSLYGGISFPVLRLKVTGTAGSDGVVAITQNQIITIEPAGSAYDAFCYGRWKGVGAAADPTGLFALGAGYGSVVSWGGGQAANSATIAGYSNVTKGGEGVLRGRSLPAVQAFGSSSLAMAARVRSGEAVSFELYYGQPYAAKAERTAYAVPKSLNTDQEGIGGARATGPQVGTSNTAWTLANGTAVTGRPGLAWFGGGLTFQFTWQKLAADGVTITDVSGPTTVTTTATTLQFTPSSFATGEKARLKVTASNSMGSGVAYSVWSTAAP